MSFTFFLTFFVFIFYKALIMKNSFLLIRNWCENYLLKYLLNRNNHSFHHMTELLPHVHLTS